MCAFRRSNHASRDRNYLLILLFSLIFILLIVPLSQEFDASPVLWRFGLSVAMIMAAMATERRRTVLWVGLALAGAIIPLNWTTYLFQAVWFVRFVHITESFFFFGMAALILSSVLQKHLATINSIYGAVCAYLLTGLAWAVLYLGLARSASGAWNISGLDTLSDLEAFSRLVYFSFVTMSTLGYGDLTPQTALLQTLSWMQSVSGQFYMAVLVAWLVSEMPRRPRNRESDGSLRRQ